MTLQFTEMQVAEPELDLTAVVEAMPEETTEVQADRLRQEQGTHRKPPRFEVSSDGGTADRQPNKPPNSKGKHATGKEKVPVVKIGPPDLREWSGFIGNVVIRWLARGFVAANFRGISEYQKLLDSDDLEDIELDDAQLQAISKPLAHTAMRIPVLQKNGRAIIDSAEGIEAAVVLVMWAGRVNRIANRLKRELGLVPDKRDRSNGRSSRGNARNRESTGGGTVGNDVGSGENVESAPESSVGIAGYHPAAGHGFN